MRTLIVIVAVALAAPLAFADQPAHLETIGRAERPPQVEAALEREAAGGGIGPIARVVDAKGHVTYQTSLRDSGRVVTLRPDGTNVARR